MKTNYFNGDILLKNKILIKKVIDSFKKGKLIAFPTETVYGLGAYVFNKNAVNNIYKVKCRPKDNPLILHIGKLDQLSLIAENIPRIALLLIKYFWPGPLTLIFKEKENIFYKGISVNKTIAVRMPSNLIIETILSQGNLILAAPSANISGKPSPTLFKHVKEDLNGKIYGIIDGGACDYGIESTILSVINGIPILLRPGSITKKMIEEVLKKEVIISETLKDKNSNLINNIIYPGMKYRHYAPKGKIYILPSSSSYNKIEEIIEKEKICFKKIALLIFDKDYEKYKDLKIKNIFFLGDKNNLKKAISCFYSILRRCDNIDVDLLFIQGVKEEGLGFSFMNRLKKAANYNYI